MEKHPCPFGGYLKCDNPDCEYRYSLSEVLHLCSDIIDKIAQGDCSQRIDLRVDRYAVQRLINSINKLAEEVGSTVDLTHELAVGICEHFDVLRRLQEGDFSARATEDSPLEIVRMLGALINKQKEAFLGYIDEIRRQNEEIIKISEQLNTILSAINIAVIISDEDMTVEFVNPEFEKLTGYSREEIVGKVKWTDFIPEDMLSKMMEYHRLRRISLSSVPAQYESKFRNKRGEIKNILLNVAMIPYTKKSIASIIDITERKRINEQIIHSQKMEALGVLSGRIVHEFNNILTGITGFSGLLYNKIEDPKLKKYVEKIMDAGEKARDLAKRLLLFSRKEEIGELQEINLNSYFIKFSDFVRPIIGRDIEFKLNIPEKGIFYKIDPAHLEVILMNLITNARDAMPEGGQLTIGLKELSLGLEYSYAHPLVKPGDYIVFCVTDTGIGMDEETKNRIFEPFFTTKPRNKGTGLGLSTVYGLVKQYDGHIHVYSEPGKGTTFKVYLPVNKKKKSAINTEALKGKETILVVDDDEHARGFITSFLKEYGYNVYEAKNGTEAFEIFGKYKDEIAVSVVDLVLPEISGIEVMKQIKTLNPQAKVIIMSGHPVEIKDIDFVEKTLSPEEFLMKIRNTIGKKD